jgi:hypothetical protein
VRSVIIEVKTPPMGVRTPADRFMALLVKEPVMGNEWTKELKMLPSPRVKIS